MSSGVGNRGWYSRLAASLGHRLVALDSDRPCVARLFEEVKESRQAVLPLLMDLTHPTLAGYAMFCGHDPSATQRLRGSLGMALALIHYLVFKKGVMRSSD